MKKGYKKGIEIIPNGWKIASLSDVSKIIMGQSPLSQFYNSTGQGLPLIQGNADILNRKTIIRSHTTSITKIGNKGDIIMSVRAPVGAISKTDFDCCLGRGICAIRRGNEYLYHYLIFIEEKWKQFSAGSTFESINSHQISNLTILIPKLAEQTAIANVLSDADKLIENLEKLIIKKRAIKQGAMQQLLTGKKRLPVFSGKWEVKTLGEVVNVFKGSGLSKSQITDKGKYPCILYGELYTCYGRVISDVISKTNSKNGALSVSGDILMPGSTTTSGIDLATASALLIDNILLGGDINIIRQKNNLYDSIFLAYYLFFHKEEISKITQGTTIHHLYGNSLKNLLIKVPSKKEQTAIAKVLSDMDAEIEALEKSLGKYRQIKTGMMQQLLSGKIRLANTAAIIPLKSKPKHNKHFNEAVIISVLASTFGTEQYPLGRFRYNKFMYLFHRKIDNDVSGYIKQAAGPYTPSVKYGGAEKIAIDKKYIRRHKAEKRTGFIADENNDEAIDYFYEWYDSNSLEWLEQFRYKSKEQLELLATVDMADQELKQKDKPVSVAAIKSFIKNEPKWQAKLSREIFSDENIKQALIELQEVL